MKTEIQVLQNLFRQLTCGIWGSIVDILTAQLGVTTPADSFKDYLKLHMQKTGASKACKSCSSSISLQQVDRVVVSLEGPQSQRELLAFAERITTRTSQHQEGHSRPML